MNNESIIPAQGPESKSISPPVEKPVLPAAPADAGVRAAASSDAVLFGEPDLSTGLIVRNLLNELDGLAALLRTAVDRSDWLNAFLLAAGMWQIAEDYLHSDPLFLQRAEKVFEGLDHPLVRIPQSVVHSARKIEAGIFQHLPRYRQVLRWTGRWQVFVQELAEAVVSIDAGQSLTDEDQAHLAAQSRVLLAESENLPAHLRRSILRLPNCFRSFDQKPADLERLTAKFAQQYPDRNVPVVVIGLRTSGNYMAPLLKSYLHQQGYPNVTAMTLRPGLDLLASEKALVREADQQNALFAVVDDPPVTGKSIVKAAAVLERMHVSRRSIVLLVPLFAGPDSVPQRLVPYAHILLPQEEWAIQHLTGPEVIRDLLSGWLLPGLTITHIEPAAVMPTDTERGHITCLYEVTIGEAGTDRHWRREVFVKGIGLGYLGEQVQDVLEHLSPYLPTIYGLRDGLEFRAWIPEEDRLNHLDVAALPAAARDIVRYVWDRHLQLPVPEDTSLRRFGNSPAWEVASDLVAHVFGRAWKFARVPLVDPVMRTLLRTSHPSIVDGNMALSKWFYTPAENRITKVAFERGVFRNGAEFTSYDPVFDLASLAADLDVAVLQGKEWARQVLSLIRSDYEQVSGDKIDEERWLLYQVVRLWQMQRTVPATQIHILKRAYARAFQRYFWARYFHDVPTPLRGEICAFDVDGVLETNYLRVFDSGGFPSLSPASATALRALALHGYRSILTTGRSLPEVIERCQLYPVAGGVAEYGAVVYSPAHGIRVLLSKEERQSLAALRKRLRWQHSIFIDPDYQYAIRAYRMDARGRRTGLGADEITGALRSLPPDSARIRAILGEEQTDFMVERIDKEVGLRELLQDLPETGGAGIDADYKPLALAVGDGPSDLPMLRIAKRAAVPAHASPALNQPGIRRYRQAYQTGLARAVNDLIKQSPHACGECPPLALDENANRLLALFAVQENGRTSILSNLLRLMRP